MIERVGQPGLASRRAGNRRRRPRVNASASRDAPSRPRACRRANGSSSNTPIGPFHRIVLASAMMRANSSTRLRADVEAHHAARDLGGRHGAAFGVGARSRRPRPRPAAPRAARHARARRARAARTSSNRSRSTRLVPTSPPSAAISVNAMAPPISSASTRSIERLDHRELVARPSRRRGSPRRAASGSSSRPDEHLDLALHQPARRRPGGRSRA